MPQQIINGVGKAGFRSLPTGGGSSFDTDAQAFITATAITDTTQKNAINDLVLDLKAAGVWTKMKALYPMVGGTATTHKFNLKDPRDLDAAYRLTFAGGWTHSSTGALPNGTTGYADTFLTPSTALTLYNNHISFYSRTNTNTGGGTDIGAYYSTSSPLLAYTCYQANGFNSNGNAVGSISSDDSYRVIYSQTKPNSFVVTSRTANNSLKMYQDGVLKGTNTTVNTSTFNGLPQTPINLTVLPLLQNGSLTRVNYSNKQCAFASIGDGLTDLESNLFYQIVEKYQYALGRNVNANQTFYFNRNYSNETNAFIFNGAISDATQQSAINTLVNDLKAAGIWTKMKAVYPMVGGTATAHKFNLVNPVDAASAYALTFNGGWTHSSTGALPNGTTGYANTNLIPNTADLGFNFNMNISFYSRTNRPSLVGPISDMGCLDVQGSYKSALIQFMNTYDLQTDGTNFILSTDTNTLGMIMASRTANNSLKAYRNGGLVGSNTATISNSLPGINYYLGAFLYRNASGGFANYYGTKECAFASIGNGLTDAEATTFYNAVQGFQTTLGRQV